VLVPLVVGPAELADAQDHEIATVGSRPETV
jgi:hypothetical protein